MKELISRAIKGHRLLRLIYENKRKVTIEPHALGRTESGEDALLCWQVAPPVSQTAAWRLFQLSKVSEMQMLEEEFEVDRGSAVHRLENWPSPTRQPGDGDNELGLAAFFVE